MNTMVEILIIYTFQEIVNFIRGFKLNRLHIPFVWPQKSEQRKGLTIYGVKIKYCQL